MIRYDGYYLSNPAYFEDGVANYSYSGFSFHAFLFKSGDLFLRSTKTSKTKNVIFSKSDFNPEFLNKFEIKGDKMEMTFEIGKEWEFIELFEIISSEELKGKEMTLRFVSW